MATATTHSRPGSITPEKSPVCQSSTLENGRGATTVTSGGFKGLSKDLGGHSLKIQEIRSSTVLTRKILVAGNPDKQYLPGQPRVRLSTASTATHTTPTTTPAKHPEKDELLEYLRENHISAELDAMLPYMKYIFVQTPSYIHIMPLHHQKAHGREVLPDENPGLHLVWYYERVFIKPIPAYFYSSAFWIYISHADSSVFRSALGFMRSWDLLVRYQLDFDLGVQWGLIPKKPEMGEYPTYEEFCGFMESFRHVKDGDVCRRYHYGELRLTRLNKTAMFFRGKLAYFHIHPQWGSYLSHILAPVITVFVILSAVLNSMQVTLAAVAGGEVRGRWKPYADVSAWFAVVVICLVAAVIFTALAGLVVMGVKDLVRAKTVRLRKERGDERAGEKTHGVIW